MLPKRNARELTESLRIRALALTGETWERNATRDMMKEAAQMIEDLETTLATAKHDAFGNHLVMMEQYTRAEKAEAKVKELEDRYGTSQS